MSPRGRGRPSRADLLRTLDRAVEDLQSVGGLPLPLEAESIWEGIWHEDAHHSTAIEGNTLVLKEVERLLAEGKAVGSKQLAEYLEVEGYAKAAQWVYAQAVEQSAQWSRTERINVTELRQIHRLVVEPAWLHSPPEGLDHREGPGSFRQHDIRPFTGGMTPPPYPDVPALVTDWLRDVHRGPAGDQHAMVFVADVHARFERIHPFRDGNGRVGRLTTNLLLVRHGYPPAVIHKRDRTRYLNALRRADRGDPEPLAEMFARSVTDGIHRFLLPGLAGPHRLVPLRSLADGELSRQRSCRRREARPAACNTADRSVVLEQAVGRGVQAAPLPAQLNSTRWNARKIEQVNFPLNTPAPCAKRCPNG